MRLSLLSLIPIAASLFTYVSAHYDDSFEAREYVDEVVVTRSFDDSLELREVLSGITSRKLLDELSERLERREWVVCPGCQKVIGKGGLWSQTMGRYFHNLKCQRIHELKVEIIRKKWGTPLTAAPSVPTNK
ncbi:hypothetical protein D9611_009593 [Ephemerocybe angulata]|uniref:Uncharacterized protein n=1 Tax=Ephemerocybe angulata TaxID=980116 RepID=A0A8H5FG96_9AGAR|nr:hypothetical protein D9611_009593 [Tulosesus angulatus]